MDNYQNKGKTITIKINGNERPFKEKNQPKVEGIIDEKEEKRDYPRSIKHTDYINQTAASETAAAVQEDDESFDWVLPEGGVFNEVKEYKIASYSTKTKKKKGLAAVNNLPKKKKDRGIVTSIFFAIFFAVLLGTSFGFIMLKLVITDHSVETAAPVELTEQETQKKDPSTTTQMANIKIEPIKTYIIQAGVFSNENSAKTVQSAISKKGVPSRVISLDGKAFLYVGAADSIENAKAMGAKFKGKGIDVYAKELTLGGGEQSKLSKSEVKLLEVAPLIFESLTSNGSSAVLSQTIPTQLLDALNKQSQEFKKIDSKQLKNKNIQQMKVDLERSIDSVNQYQKTQDPKYINNLQETLLSFLATYSSL